MTEPIAQLQIPMAKPANEPPTVDNEEIIAYLKWKYHTGDKINLRIKRRTGGATNEMYTFDDATAEKIARVISKLDDETIMAYWTNLQHITPSYDPSAVDDKGEVKGNSVSDADIDKINYIGIDVDAIFHILGKKGNYNSTDAEMKDALAVTREVADYLDHFGWPKPCIKASGNGGQLEYPANLSVKDAGLYGRFLEGLSGKFDPLAIEAAKYESQKKKETDEQRVVREGKLYEINLKRRGEIDTTMKNPSRMIKISGTPTRKGDHTEERPQRTAHTLSLPAYRTFVTEDMLKEVIKDLEQYLPKTITEPSDEGNKPKKDTYEHSVGYLEWFIQQHDIKIQRVEEDDKFKKYILAANTCPNARAHSLLDGENSTASVLLVLKNDAEYERDGKAVKSKRGSIFYQCSHNHCGGFSWYDFKAAYDIKFGLTQRIIQKTGNGKDGQIPDNSYLVEMLSDYETVKDINGEMYVIVKGERGNPMILDAGGREFLSMLSKQFCDLMGKAPSMKAMKEALLVKYAETKITKRLAVRTTAEHMDDDANRTIWYDLCNDAGDAVRVTKDGMQIIKKPLIFKSNAFQAPQVVPDLEHGNIKKMYDILDMNITFDVEHNAKPAEGVDITRIQEYEKEVAAAKKEADDLRLFITTFIVYQFIPDTPEHPMSMMGLNINGAPGSAKTELTTSIHNLIDPVVEDDTLRKPDKISDLELYLSSVYYAAIDNINELGQAESDLICGCATGTVITKRVLYFDREMIRLRIKLGVLLNGIASIIKRGDAARRYVFLWLNPLRPEQTKPVAVVSKRYKDLKPIILGGVFNTLQKALAAYPTLKNADALKEGMSTMASFDEWGYVIAEQIETDGGERFLSIYKALCKDRDAGMVGENIVSTALMEWMGERKDSGYVVMSSLRDELYGILVKEDAGKEIGRAQRRQIDEEFPTTAHELRKELLTIRGGLAQLGYDVIVRKPKLDGTRTGKEWNVRVVKT